MKGKLAFIFLLGILLSLSLTSCSDKSTNPTNNDIGAANVIARQGMDLLNTEVERLQNMDSVDHPNDQTMMTTTKYNQIKSKFEDALVQDADNPMANVGLAVLDLVQINYDPELWSLYNQVDSLAAENRFLNNQIGFFANSPTVLFKSFEMAKSQPLSIMRFQNFVKNSVIPRLDNAKQHLNTAIALADSDFIMINTDEEDVEIDRGEIYAFKAEVELVTAAFQMMTAYNWDMVDSNDTYNWITDMANMTGVEYDHHNAFAYNVSNDVLTIKYWDDDFNDSEVKAQELAAKTLKYNIDHKPAFATLTDLSSLTAAKANISAAIQDVQDGMDYVLAESDNQNNDVIKIQNILDMNHDIADHDPDAPAFMQNWDSVSDVVTWLQTLLTGPYTTTINHNNVNIDVSINVSAYFNGNLSDLREVQPYVQWNDPNTSWIIDELSWHSDWDNMTQYSFTYQGQPITVATGFHSIRFEYYDKTVEVGHLIDGPSGTVIAHDEVPYFPDYTFKGLFPGMTRAKLIQLSE